MGSAQQQGARHTQQAAKVMYLWVPGLVSQRVGRCLMHMQMWWWGTSAHVHWCCLSICVCMPAYASPSSQAHLETSPAQPRLWAQAAAPHQLLVAMQTQPHWGSNALVSQRERLKRCWFLVWGPTFPPAQEATDEHPYTQAGSLSFTFTALNPSPVTCFLTLLLLLLLPLSCRLQVSGAACWWRSRHTGSSSSSWRRWCRACRSRPCQQCSSCTSSSRVAAPQGSCCRTSTTRCRWQRG